MSGLIGIQNPREAFERVVCVNLDRRPDRWRRFSEGLPPDWPWPVPVRFSAVDAQQVKHPEHWHSGGGAWGCYRSHLAIIEQALNAGVRSILILEDDALFPDGFSARACDWLRSVPANWQMLYLGGQHLRAGIRPPIEILGAGVGAGVGGVFQPYNVNRTHAYALQGDMLRIVYHHLLRTDWHRRNHIDHHLGRLHQQRKHRIYCPGEWLVGQAGGKSNISGRAPPDRFWKSADQIAAVREPPPTSPQSSPASLVAIVGTHASGSSALAQACWHLGMWFGQTGELTGYWGEDSPARGGEHRQLAGLLEQTAPLDAVEHAKPRAWRWKRLQAFIQRLQAEAAGRGQLAAAKYPQLCLVGQQLQAICGQGLRVIVIQRPLEESIASLQRRTEASGKEAERIAEHQRWLAGGRDAIAREIPGQVLEIQYAGLLADPAAELQRVVDWLGLQPTAGQLAEAVAAIKPRGTA